MVDEDDVYIDKTFKADQRESNNFIIRRKVAGALIQLECMQL